MRRPTVRRQGRRRTALPISCLLPKRPESRDSDAEHRTFLRGLCRNGSRKILDFENFPPRPIPMPTGIQRWMQIPLAARVLMNCALYGVTTREGIGKRCSHFRARRKIVSTGTKPRITHHGCHQKKGTPVMKRGFKGGISQERDRPGFYPVRAPSGFEENCPVSRRPWSVQRKQHVRRPAFRRSSV